MRTQKPNPLERGVDSGSSQNLPGYTLKEFPESTPGGRFWERGVDSGSSQNLPGYTLKEFPESTPGGRFWERGVDSGKFPESTRVYFEGG